MQFHKWRHGRQAILPTALLASLWLIPMGAHAATSYLQELEAEASRTDNEQNTPAAPQDSKPAWSAGQQSLSEKIPPGLNKTQFEQRLKQSYFGSHLFYSKLGAADQQSVYEDYKKDNSISNIRESIKSHMKSE